MPSILCLEVAGFTAGLAIVLAIFAEANAVLGETVTAIPFAFTFPFRKIAHRTYKILRHEVEIIANRKRPQSPLVTAFS